MQTILITGGTGLVGRHLSRLLKTEGYRVIHLSRFADLNAEFPAYAWDLEKQTLDKRALANTYAIIHLAGAGIADKRWTDSRKEEIINSRVQSTHLLARFLSELEPMQRPKLVIGASAIGLYGDRGEETLTEQSSAGADFMATTCRDWEASYQKIKDLDILCPIVRIGIVLSTQGGALAKMLPSYKLKVGAYFGDGRQYYSWIHIRDLARIFIFLLNNEPKHQIYNACAPQPVTNYQLAKAISEARQSSALLVPVPAFALHIAMGEMVAVILQSAKVLPQNLQAEQFQFLYEEVTPALRDLIKSKD